MVTRSEGLQYAIGQGYSQLDAKASRDRLDGYAVVSGLAVSAGSGLSVDVASGTATVGETSGSVDTVSNGSTTNVSLAAADGSNPRKDTIYIDTGGSLQAETGVAEGATPSGKTQFDTFQPEPPTPSTEGVILAEVWVPAGASSLSSGDIRDRRQPAQAVFDDVTTQSLDSGPATIQGTGDKVANVVGDGFVGLAVEAYRDSPSDHALPQFYAARGTESSPSALQSGDRIVTFRPRGYGDTGFNILGDIVAKATEAHTDSAGGMEWVFKTIPNGSTTATDALILNQDQTVTVPNGGADIENVSLTDPTLVYVYGANGNYVDTYDPANFSDVFAALNQVMSDVSDSDHVVIKLPYTGSSGISASTTFTVPAGQKTPSIHGHGWYGTRIDYTATDGTPAIEVPAPENEEGYTWEGFHLSGPGSGASGGGNGIEIGDGTGDSTNHGQWLHKIKSTDFPGIGMQVYGFFTGTIARCQVENNGGIGLWVDRLNGGNIQNVMAKNNNGTAQVYLRDSVGGYFGPGNDIDAAGGGSTPAGSIGLLVEAVNKRVGPFIVGNYFEDNETHLDFGDGGLPNRGVVAAFNRFQQGTTGIRVQKLDPNNYGGYFTGNLFQGCGTQDFLLDTGDAVLGPNFHQNSTTKVTDNASGDFASVSQTTGSYPW